MRINEGETLSRGGKNLNDNPRLQGTFSSARKVRTSVPLVDAR